MLDIHGLFNFKVKQLTEFDGQETESGIDPIACAQDIDSLAFLTEKAICLQDSFFKGNYNLIDGMSIAVELSSKQQFEQCFNIEGVSCPGFIQQQLDTITSYDSFYIDVFSQEKYFDYEDFGQPIHSKSKILD